LQTGRIADLFRNDDTAGLIDGCLRGVRRMRGRIQKGRPYNNSYVAFLWVQNGQITRLREFFNPLVWLASLDRVPALPSRQR
jgi:ketosteroid isomerase-like protein